MFSYSDFVAAYATSSGTLACVAQMTRTAKVSTSRSTPLYVPANAIQPWRSRVVFLQTFHGSPGQGDNRDVVTTGQLNNRRGGCSGCNQRCVKVAILDLFNRLGERGKIFLNFCFFSKP